MAYPHQEGLEFLKLLGSLLESPHSCEIQVTAEKCPELKFASISRELEQRVTLKWKSKIRKTKSHPDVLCPLWMLAEGGSGCLTMTESTCWGQPPGLYFTGTLAPGGSLSSKHGSFPFANRKALWADVVRAVSKNRIKIKASGPFQWCLSPHHLCALLIPPSTSSKPYPFHALLCSRNWSRLAARGGHGPYFKGSEPEEHTSCFPPTSPQQSPSLSIYISILIDWMYYQGCTSYVICSRIP